MLLYLTPGDPVGVILGPDASEQQKAELRSRLGLDQPAYTQLLRWYVRLAQGDLGSSIFLNKTVTAAFVERLEPTIMLTILALIFGVVIGMPAGIFAARMRGSWFDLRHHSGGYGRDLYAHLLIGLNLIFVFAVTLGWAAGGGLSTAFPRTVGASGTC